MIFINGHAFRLLQTILRSRTEREKKNFPEALHAAFAIRQDCCGAFADEPKSSARFGVVNRIQAVMEPVLLIDLALLPLADDD